MSKIDREVSDLVASFQDGHAFHLPELGVTMADGGEELGKKEETVTAMTCPFLKEAQVKYCRTSSVRKLIPLAAGRPGGREMLLGGISHLPGLPQQSGEQAVSAIARTWASR